MLWRCWMSDSKRWDKLHNYLNTELCVNFQSTGHVARGPYRNKQEAQLSPRDRAMRRVNWNLANCHATVQKLLIRQVLTKTTAWSWRFSRRQCVIDNVNSTMTRPNRLPLSQVSYTNRRRSSTVYHLYTDDLLRRNFPSPQCRNCSRDHDHAHLGSTHSSQDYKTSHGRPVYKI